MCCGYCSLYTFIPPLGGWVNVVCKDPVLPPFKIRHSMEKESQFFRKFNFNLKIVPTNHICEVYFLRQEAGTNYCLVVKIQI